MPDQAPDSPTETLTASLIQRTERITTGIADFTADALLSNGNFPTDTYYGEAYACDLWWRKGASYALPLERTLQAIGDWEDAAGRLRKTNRFVWEFIVHALYPMSGDRPDVQGLLDRWHPIAASVTNYRLLRYLANFRTGRRSRLHSSITAAWAVWHPPASRFEFPSDWSGVIKDRHQQYSLQYHAFSTALLHEFWTETGIGHFRRRFLKAADLLMDMTLPNGDVCYVGRGQEQIFGQASVFYVFAAAYHLTGQVTYLEHADLVLAYLERHTRPDGSIPLILNEREEGYPLERPDITRTEFFGWYVYNDYFDYLPMCGAMLARATPLLSSSDAAYTRRRRSPKSPQFRIVRKEKYTAALSRPYQDRNNNLALPYICLDRESVSPCFGGEQYAPSIYRLEALPLPYIEAEGVDRKLFLQDECRYRWEGLTLVGQGPGLKHLRRFAFEAEGYVLEDSIAVDPSLASTWSGAELVWNYLFFDMEPGNPEWSVLDRDGKIWGKLSASRPLSVERDGLFCARGPIVAARYRETLRPGTSHLRLSLQFDRRRLGYEDADTAVGPDIGCDCMRES